MAYLVTEFPGVHVVGLEGIDLALHEFASEHPTLDIKKCDGTIHDHEASCTTSHYGFQRYVGKNIELLHGDYFELDETVTGGTFHAMYDRGSFVAIDPTLRQSYVDIQEKLLGPGGKILLVALERKGTEEGMKMGPPFTIPESVVHELYGTRDWCESITVLEQIDQLERVPEDRQRYPELDQLLETVYLIQRKK
jgi:hypothetical protein